MRAGVRAGEKLMQLRILTTALALALPASALAQDDATDLDRITVTATRTAVTVDQSLSAVEVIDRDEIERSQAHSLPQLLRGRAGINLVNQGGLGKLTTLFMRGTESDQGAECAAEFGGHLVGRADRRPGPSVARPVPDRCGRAPHRGAIGWSGGC